MHSENIEYWMSWKTSMLTTKTHFPVVGMLCNLWSLLRKAFGQMADILLQLCNVPDLNYHPDVGNMIRCILSFISPVREDDEAPLSPSEQYRINSSMRRPETLHFCFAILFQDHWTICFKQTMSFQLSFYWPNVVAATKDFSQNRARAQKLLLRSTYAVSIPTDGEWYRKGSKSSLPNIDRFV